jgi:glycosyltransferase involved in cell wall biosynthesis
MNNREEGRRLLFVCSDYYPPSSVSGAIMSHYIVKYLGKIGWEVAVLTSAHPESKGRLRPSQGYENKVFYSLPPPSPSYETIENWGNKKFGAYLRPLFSYLAGYGTPIWHLKAKKIALSIIRNFNPQIIIASHPEPKCLLLAKQLSKEKGIPWIAFMYDPWSKAPRGNNAPVGGYFNRLKEKIERKTLQGVSAILTVSESWEFIIDEKRTPVFIIHRGFDPEVLSYEVKLLPQFTITFAGSLFALERDPSPLLFAISRLAKEGFWGKYPIRARFFLHSEKDREIMRNLANNLGIESAVDVFSPINYKELLVKEKESSCLLLLTHHQSYYTASLADYLACRRPILAIMPKNCLAARLIQKTGVGFICENEEEVYDFLKKATLEFYQNGDIEWHPDSRAIEEFSWDKQTEKLSRILEEIIEKERIG